MGANDKAAATFHHDPAPDPTPYECADCGQRWATRSVAQDCCDDTVGLAYD